MDDLKPKMLGVLRIAVALVLFSYGTQKILGFPVAEQVPPVGSMPWIAGLFELFGGFALLVGFQVRVVAFVLSGLMASAYFMAHFPRGLFPSLNGGSLAAVLSFVFLYFAVAGAGAFSIDAKRGKA